MDAVINILCLFVPYLLLSHRKIKFLQGHMFRKLMLSLTVTALLGSFLAKFFSIDWVIDPRHNYDAPELFNISLEVALLPFIAFLFTFIPNPFKRRKKGSQMNSEEKDKDED